MTSWRQTLRLALVGLSAGALLFGCAGTDDDNGSGGGTGGVQQGNEGEAGFPSQINFPSVNVGDSISKDFEISNTGGAELTVTEIQINEGDEDSDREFRAGDKWRTSAKLAPNESVELTVVYNPLNAVQDSGSIEFKTDGAKSGVQSIDLKPEKLAPQVNVPDTVNFSSAQPGTTVWQKFQVRNVGQAPLTVNKLQVQGSSLFKLTAPTAEAGGDGDKKNNQQEESLKPEDDKPLSDKLPVTLAPNESVAVRGWFMPEDNNPESAKVTIFSNDPSGKQTLKLVGNSKAPCLGLSHDKKLDFETAQIKKVSQKTMTMENCRPRSKKDLKIRDISVTDDGNGVFGLEQGSLPKEIDNGNTLTLSGGTQSNFVVTFSPPKNKTYTGELTIKSNDPTRTEHQIELTGKGTDNTCPTANAKAKVEGSSLEKEKINTLPLETIVFNGTKSSDADGTVKRYEWSLIDRPADSTARLTPNSNVKKPNLFLDLAGTYKVELTVFDDRGLASCQPSVVTIEAIPNEDIHVQLVWDTPADNDQSDGSGADLDLHYLHPDAASWNKAPWDVFWNNGNPDWGQMGFGGDDPSLDIDDTDGAGPENINHDKPTPGKSYKVGVYYYDDHGFGPSYATVRIYIRGKLAQEFKNKFLSGTFAFWKVGLVNWPTGNIFVRDEKFQGFPSNP